MGPRGEKFWEWEKEELKGCCFRTLKDKHTFCDFASCLLNSACVEIFINVSRGDRVPYNVVGISRSL
jgi:hypothetical protein